MYSVQSTPCSYLQYHMYLNLSTSASPVLTAGCLISDAKYRAYSLTFSLSQWKGKGSHQHLSLKLTSPLVYRFHFQCSISDRDPCLCTSMYVHGTYERGSTKNQIPTGVYPPWLSTYVLCTMYLDWSSDTVYLLGARDELCGWTGGKNLVVPCRYIVLCYAMC